MAAPLKHDTAATIAAVTTLMAAKDVAELARAALDVASKWLDVDEVTVLLSAPGGEAVEGRSRPAGERGASALETWALELLRAGPLQGLTSAGQRLAASLESRDGIRGVVAMSRAERGGDPSAALVELARLVAACADQMGARARAAQTLKDAQLHLAKGLHDLRTPLNSLRLGMHLLEPGLAGQDQAVVQRTHRAVDRMATLVTEMFDALHKP